MATTTTVTRRPTEAQKPGGDAGRLVLRLAVGILILLHGIAKLSGPLDPIAGMLAKVGLPGFLAYGVYIGEILAPILLIVGVWTRAAAVVIAINMVFAVLLAHSSELFSLGRQGGYALELQAMFLLAAVAIALLGAGRFSVGGRYGPMN
ncbi:MAG TPA: DoxX family protein [Caldimonas sp.]|jgi:putative oxidoreductase|nr:DoxX family protein [Caldimonas sp.]HEX2542645.1 DoxX family protein [Caldimonas sp.]